MGQIFVYFMQAHTLYIDLLNITSANKIMCPFKIDSALKSNGTALMHLKTPYARRAGSCHVRPQINLYIMMGAIQTIK